MTPTNLTLCSPSTFPVILQLSTCTYTSTCYTAHFSVLLHSHDPSHPFSFSRRFAVIVVVYLFIISSVSCDTNQFHHSCFPPKAKADLVIKALPINASSALKLYLHYYANTPPTFFPHHFDSLHLKQLHPLFFFPSHNNTKSWDRDPQSFELNEICRPITHQM